MALFNPNVDTIEEVLAIRKTAMEAVRNGLTVMSWSSENSSANLQFTLPVREVLEETMAYLQKVDPDLYGVRVKKAKAIFS